MCTGRIDLAHVLRAFSSGVDGVFIGGCRLDDCNYTTQGNYHALNLVLLFKKIMEQIGINPERLRIEFMSSGEGNIFAEVVDDFVNKVKESGPIGKDEDIDQNALNFKLKAIEKLIPYIRLVESERLRAHYNSMEECMEFYSSAEFVELFNELIGDKLAMSQIFMLLQEKPHSAGEISKILGMTQSEISRHLNCSAEQGLVRFEESQKSFALA